MFSETIGFKSNSKVRASIESIVQYSSHMHANAIEIICVLEGIIGISDSAISHKLSSGDVYIFNAKDPHKISAISESNIVLTVQIDLSHYKKYFKKLDVTYFICDSFIQKERLTVELNHLRFLLAKIYDGYHSYAINEVALEGHAKSLLEFLIYHFQYYTYSKNKNNSYDIIRRQEAQSEDPYFNRIYEIIDYIYANFSTKIHLQEIADCQYLSIYYLSRYIKKACGLSFSEIVSIARCEEAERLLGSTNKTVDAIALDVGFCNRKHLNTQFQKWFQKSPSEYRKALSPQFGLQSKIQFQEFDQHYAISIIESYLH